MSDHHGSNHDDEDDDGPIQRHEEHEEGGHVEPWLVSYADLMTLLFGFFVIMYAFSIAKLEENANNDDYIRLKKSIAAYFGGGTVDPMKETEKKIEEAIAKVPEIKNSVQISSTPDGLKITITSQLLFASGKSDVLPGALSIINKMADEIISTGKYTLVKLEGYTDDEPIRHIENMTNWDLSAARAISVLKIFENKGVPPEKLQAIGFGQNHPMVPNRDENGNAIPENQAKNRRVVIRVVAEDKEMTPKPLPVKAPPHEASH